MQPDADDLMRAMRQRIRRKIEADLAREAAEGNAHRERVLPLVRDAVRQAREAGLLDGRVWLIGSYAWGTPTGRSDVDLVAETCEDRLAVASLVGDATGLDVHVMRLADAAPVLQPHILSEGVPL